MLTLTPAVKEGIFSGNISAFYLSKSSLDNNDDNNNGRKMPPGSNLGCRLRGPFLTSTLGTNFDIQGRRCPPGLVNFVPKGWSYPMGVKFSVCPSILLNNRERSPLGVNEGVNIPPRGQNSSLGAGCVCVKLRMALSVARGLRAAFYTRARRELRA
jgi:hypothetical protein